MRLPSRPEQSRRRCVLEEDHRAEVVVGSSRDRGEQGVGPLSQVAAQISHLGEDARLRDRDTGSRSAHVPGRPAMHHRLMRQQLVGRPRRAGRNPRRGAGAGMRVEHLVDARTDGAQAVLECQAHRRGTMLPEPARTR
nr:hypothetical protein [Occultella kanbiaonis]